MLELKYRSERCYSIINLDLGLGELSEQDSKVDSGGSTDWEKLFAGDQLKGKVEAIIEDDQEEGSMSGISPKMQLSS
ncbi:MAG: hypothetical protein IPK58_25100 [Acidobacteria bacterium]|nr:hypothetical protein [Acidobacteriota bacterium]